MHDQKNGRQPRVIVLDFDGVVVESNQIKDEAFRNVFVNYDEHVDDVYEYHLANPALNRYEKFDHIQKNIVKGEKPEIVRDWANKFSTATFDGVSKCEMVEGATEFLEHFSKLGTKLYLASMTPQEELLRILNARGLVKYFTGIHGAPLNKAEVLKKIAFTERIELSEMVFIGDSPSDLKSAKAAGVPFVGRNSGTPLPQPTFRNLRDIKIYLESKR